MDSKKYGNCRTYQQDHMKICRTFFSLQKLTAIKRRIIYNQKRGGKKDPQIRYRKIIQNSDQNIFFLFGIFITEIQPCRSHQYNPDMLKLMPKDNLLGYFYFFYRKLTYRINPG